MVMARKTRRGSAPESLASVVAKSIFRFTNSQWREIEKYSGLPSKARGDVEACVGLFRHFQAVIAARATQAELRKEINNLHRNAVRLLEDLKGLSPYAVAILWSPEEIVPDWADPRLDETKPPRLEAAISEVTQLVRWFRFATFQVRRKPGPTPENVRYLVGELDNILAQYTGRRISRSYKSTTAAFVQMVCKIAELTVGPGTIDAAMKHCITHRGRIHGENYD